MSPLREDCKSFSSYSSLLFELDIPLFTHRIILLSSSFHNCCFKRKFAFKGRKCTQFFSHSPLQNCPVSLQKVLVPKPFLCYSPVLDGRTQNVIQYGVVAIICGFKTADFVSLFAAKDNDSWRKRKRSRKGENLIFFWCIFCVCLIWMLHKLVLKMSMYLNANLLSVHVFPGGTFFFFKNFFIDLKVTLFSHLRTFSFVRTETGGGLSSILYENHLSSTKYWNTGFYLSACFKELL